MIDDILKIILFKISNNITEEQAKDMLLDILKTNTQKQVFDVLRNLKENKVINLKIYKDFLRLIK